MRNFHFLVAIFLLLEFASPGVYSLNRYDITPDKARDGRRTHAIGRRSSEDGDSNQDQVSSGVDADQHAVVDLDKRTHRPNYRQRYSKRNGYNNYPAGMLSESPDKKDIGPSKEQSVDNVHKRDYDFDDLSAEEDDNGEIGNIWKREDRKSTFPDIDFPPPPYLFLDEKRRPVDSLNQNDIDDSSKERIVGDLGKRAASNSSFWSGWFGLGGPHVLKVESPNAEKRPVDSFNQNNVVKTSDEKVVVSAHGGLEKKSAKADRYDGIVSGEETSSLGLRPKDTPRYWKRFKINLI
jgi:hypothetical protein